MDLTELLEKLRLDHDVPGAAIAILTGDDVVDAAAGVANRRTGVPATTDTLFQIGSVTKVYTTTLVMQLVDEGVLDLDAPVRRYVPDLVLSDESVASTLLVRQLLNHTSGLPGDFFPDTGRGDDCLERYLAILADVELSHPLGAMFSYSNAAFVLAGLVIERVTGGTWDAALRQRLLQPLGLQSTVTLPEEALLHRAAVGHLGTGAEQRVAPQWVLPRNCGPAGLVAAPAREVVEFARLHLTGGLARSGTRVVSDTGLARMQQVTVAVPGMSQGRLGFGLGWGIGEWSGATVLQHDGGTIGQSCALRVLPAQQAAIALVANGGDWIGFRDAVLEEIAPRFDVKPTAAPTPAPGAEAAAVPDAVDYVGTFGNAGAHFDIRVDGAGLRLSERILDPLEKLATEAPTEVGLVPHGTDLFLARVPNTSRWAPVVFLRDGAGTFAYVHVGGRAARRIPDRGPTPD